ncbi:transposase, partial [Hungatella hathewayi]
MEKAFKYRIYPNKKQKQILAETFGCVRFIYNHYLNKRIKLYKSDKESFGYSKCSQDLTQLKKQEEYEWLRDVDSIALQSSLKNLEAAFKNYFEQPEAGFPKFKSKKCRKQSYTTRSTNGNIAVLDR